MNAAPTCLYFSQISAKDELANRGFESYVHVWLTWSAFVPWFAAFSTLETNEAEMPLTIWVAIGGALGSVARYWVALWMAPLSRDLPWGTILINITGSFAIAFFGGLTVAQGRFPVSDAGRIFFMVGICGGYTTFSSFSLQTLELLKAGAVTRAMLNIGLSVLLCMLSVTAGYLVAERFNGGVKEVAQNIVEEEAS